MSDQLVAMRKAGLKSDQIAASLGVSPGALQSRITELILSGRLASRRGLLRAQPDCYVEGQEQTVQAVTNGVRRLYREGKTHKEIGTELRLTENQVHNILSILFAAGLPKRERGLTDDQAQAIYNTYLAGGSIDTLAQEIGFTGPTVRKRLRKLKLPIGTERVGTKRGSVASEHGGSFQAG